MNEQKITTEISVETVENPNNDFKNGAIVLVGTIVAIVILRFLSNLAQKQKSTNQSD